MKRELKLYNTLGQKLEVFEPLHPPFVGMYLCGPTVYGHPHLGHCRGPLFIDVVFRYLRHLGYRVRYVRNITDVGHLLDDADDGEDKVLKRARLEKLEPMEVAELYTLSFRENMARLNILPPSIEPRASGHITEQTGMIQSIIREGLAYEVNGSVYFDVEAYSKKYPYGILSGRVLEELLSGAGSRELEGQEEKRNPADFALWKKGGPEHIMRWPSPWGSGFPGWHIECSAMSAKYLGHPFDIHAGGMDLLFPHHESEIAQSTACHHSGPVKYWLHNNMITINGQKMAKSLGNGILIEELFTGRHPLLEQAYQPMTLRFFVLQAHYRGTLDFSNEALKAAEKGLERLMDAANTLEKIPSGDRSDFDIKAWEDKLYAALNDDFNTPVAISHLFEAVKWINTVSEERAALTEKDLELLKSTYTTFLTGILGLKTPEDKGHGKTGELVNLILDLRNEARERKDFDTSDRIRDRLLELGFEIRDGKEGSRFNQK